MGELHDEDLLGLTIDGGVVRRFGMQILANQFSRVLETAQTQWYMDAVQMNELGRALIVLGSILVVVGIVLMLAGRVNVPLGRLPGDIVYRGKNSTIYFPLATSVVVSVVLTILLWVVGRWRR
jgi:preprotein translocase subunit SecY